MGIDAGILVTRQITDQGRWLQAMLEVHRVFSREEYFHRLPAGPPEAGAFTQAKADLWELQEPLNFAGMHSNRYQWETYHGFLEGVKTVAELRERASSLEEDFRKVREPESSGWRAYKLERDLGRAKFALSTVEATLGSDPFQLETSALKRAASSINDPPKLFSFTLGEGPRLPVFARHFVSFESKVSGSCGAVEDQALSQQPPSPDRCTTTHSHEPNWHHTRKTV